MKKERQYRIVQIKDGFSIKFFVQIKYSFLLFKWWWNIDWFITRQDAKEYIDQLKVPLTKIILS